MLAIYNNTMGRMFSLGEYIILLDEKDRKYLVKLENRKFSTDLGILDLGEIVGKEPGVRVRTHLNKEFIALRPSRVDFLEKIRRAPQIILTKDAAQIVGMTGIGPGSIVVDCGTGSGALAIFLGSLVKPDGHVYSYENREEFVNLARRNVEIAGLSEIVTVKLKDVITDGIDERGVDLVTIDMGGPELVVPKAEEALKVGGYIAIFSPCIEPVQKVYEALRSNGFREMKTVECLVRNIEVRPGATRPSTRVIGHTGYITVARKV
ncbi:MAG: tRNA (adenine-N1)-methyltransferase [Candidatus Hadarchaeales archaeon]